MDHDRPDTEEQPRNKRRKMSSEDMDPKANPYLAHYYEDSANDAYNNGFGYASSQLRGNGMQQQMPLSKFPRHATNAAMAMKAEDGPTNPFSGQPLSNRYFSILKTRRDLPVHAQR